MIKKGKLGKNNEVNNSKVYTEYAGQTKNKVEKEADVSAVRYPGLEVPPSHAARPHGIQAVLDSVAQCRS